jgi:hypothetical protein
MVSESVRQFLIRGALFGSIQVCVLGTVEFRLERTSNTYLEKASAMEARAGTIQVLSVGSSQMDAAFDPDALGPPAANLANPSQDILYSVALTRKYVPRLASLRTVLFEIAYFSLESDIRDTPEHWRSFFYRRVFGIPHRDAGDEYDLRNYSWVALYGGTESLARVFSSSRLGAHQATANERRDLDPASGARRLKYHHSLMKQERIAANLRETETLFDELRARGLRVVIVTPPVFTTYSSHVDPARYRRFQDAVRDLARRYGAEYANYFDDRRFEAADFSNHDHLNPKGANKFTLLLARELKL